MATSNVCTYSNDDEESDYSFEYVTDSEYESEEGDVDQDEDQVQGKEVVTQTIKIPIKEQMIENEDEEEKECVDANNKSTDSPTNTLSKEQIEAMKPKLPHYVTDPEPCAFSDDPGQWIAWMETQVNNERERRMKKLMESNSFEATEVNGCNEDSHSIELEGIDENILDDNPVPEEEEETCNINEDKEEDISNLILEEETSLNCQERVTEEVNIVETISNDNAEDYGCQEDSEWEYEEDKEEEENIDSKDALKENEKNDIQITDKDTTDNANEMEITQDTQENEKNDIQITDKDTTDNANEMEITQDTLEDNQETEIELTEEEELTNNQTDYMEITPEITIDAPKEDISSDIESSDTSALKSADTDISLSQIAYKKQVSCSAIPDPSILPSDMQKKIDFIRKKKASLGPLTGETQASAAKSSLNNLLDEEMQRKIDFVRQKKLEASQQSPSSASHENLSVKNSFLRQMSTPENQNRPQSFASDAGLDDMLTRIKALRNERKQMLQDMSAIRNAFGGNEPGVNDDGIGSGNNTPSSDMIGSFSMDTDENRSDSPSIPDVVLSRQHRRSIDSGIGSKSLSSIQDGSPTAELDHPAANNHPVIRKVSREKANPEDIVCFICGENMGKLSKGPIMHMGLEDGDPVCPDALYLTDECKEKIRQIGQTKSFTFEAKYELLETLELESWDMDSDITSGDLINRVDAFLIDVEAQKEKDKERFNAMRSGAIDDVFNEEFADLMNSSSISKSRSFEGSCDKMEVDLGESQQLSRISHIPPPAPPPPPKSLSDKYSELSGEDSISSKHSLPSPKIEMSAVHNAIKSGIHKLKHTDTCEKSEIPMGKVIYKKIAPRVFNSDVRSLVRDISKEDHRKRLKKVKTNDKSKPFIPDDVEIYFYGGANAPASNAPLPPTSKLKYSSSCLKR